MNIVLAAIVPRRSRSKGDSFEALIADYISRADRYVSTEAQLFESEAQFLEFMAAQSGRQKPFLVLLDSRGKQLSSEEIAINLKTHQEKGTQRLVFAVGPANGWSEQTKSIAGMLLSFGRITLPHRLARVVLAEQVYRALTILAGHPYHSGH